MENRTVISTHPKPWAAVTLQGFAPLARRLVSLFLLPKFNFSSILHTLVIFAVVHSQNVQ